MGTPKSLKDAVRRSLVIALRHCWSDTAVDRAEDVIKDFIRQRLQLAMLSHPDQEGMLRDLINSIETNNVPRGTKETE